MFHIMFWSTFWTAWPLFGEWAWRTDPDTRTPEVRKLIPFHHVLHVLTVALRPVSFIRT